ncbi:MAG: DUF6285 domain-containing protein [Sphingobium sp.]
MRTIPTASELLEIISEYLRNTVSKKLSAPDNFYALVAANSLDIVRREIEQGPAADDAARARLRDLLGTDGTLAAMDAQLVDAIASGAMPIGSPALQDHLLRTTLDEAAIDQPKYASYQHMLEVMRRGNDDGAGGTG